MYKSRLPIFFTLCLGLKGFAKKVSDFNLHLHSEFHMIKILLNLCRNSIFFLSSHFRVWYDNVNSMKQVFNYCSFYGRRVVWIITKIFIAVNIFPINTIGSIFNIARFQTSWHSRLTFICIFDHWFLTKRLNIITFLTTFHIAILLDFNFETKWNIVLSKFTSFICCSFIYILLLAI